MLRVHLRWLEVLNDVLQVEDVGAAHPRITEAVENMVKKGKWTVPGTSITSGQSRSIANTSFVFRVQGEIRRAVTRIEQLYPVLLENVTALG